MKGRTVKAPEFKTCTWKKYYDAITTDYKYVVEMNDRIATSVSGKYCNVIGNAPLPFNKVTSWKIKILISEKSNGSGIFIGVAPSDIDQYGDYNYGKYGWYFDCFDSTLRSGPPHKYGYKVYGQRKWDGKYVQTGDSVGVVMDTIKGELSFVVDGKNLGVAYEGIPLDKPLVPCVILKNGGDSIELVI